MKKKLSRMLALLCTLALAFTMMSVPAWAETETDTDAPTSGVDGAISWKVEGSTLTISGKGEIKDNYFPWKEHADKIQTLVIEDGVTSISSRAFINFRVLKNVAIPASVQKIGETAFSGCENLISVEIPDGVTTIQPYTFMGCRVLENIKIPKSVTKIRESAFAYCGKLNDIEYTGTQNEWKEIEIDGGGVDINDNWERVDINDNLVIKDATVKCTDGTIIPTDADGFYFGHDGGDYKWKFDEKTGKLTLKGTEMPTWWIEKSGHTIAPWVQRGFTVKSVEILDGMKNIGSGAFWSQDELVSVAMPASIKTIGDVAFSCTELTNIIIPEGVQRIGDSALKGGLTSVHIPASVTEIGYRAFGTNTVSRVLQSITVDEKNPNYTSVGGALYSKDRKNLIQVPEALPGELIIPDGVETIKKGACIQCENITGIIIPASVRTIEDEGLACTNDLVYEDGEWKRIPKLIRFVGDAPAMVDNSGSDDPLDDWGSFYGTIATVYYPKDNKTWTEDVRKQYGGTLTWEAYDPANPPETTPVSVTAVKLDKTTASVEVGKTLTLTATVEPANASDKTVTWKSSDESVATVDTAGVVTAKKAGTADIIVTTKDGNKTASCKVTVAAEHVHDYSKEEVTKEPTCTEPGEKTLTCSCGESKTEEIPALGHKTEVQGKKEATCGADGYTGDTVCTVCKEVLEKGEVIPKTGKHTYQSEVTKEPTCTEKGEKTRTCSVCGDIQKEDMDALGHNYMPEVTKEPTADEKGERTYTCTRCEDSYTEEIPVLPSADHRHDYKEEVTTEPTCTKSGVKTYTCDGCGDSYTEPVDALGHDYESEVTKPATVDEEGIRTYTCTVCGDTYTEAIPKVTKPGTSDNNTGTTGTPGIVPPTVPGEPQQPTTPGAPTAAELARENWTASNGTFTHKDTDGKNSTGSRWIESNGVGHRYIFGTDGVLQTGKASAAGTTVTAAGEILLNGNLYYLNPDRNVNDPRTCYVMTDYLQIRDNYAGQTYFDKDGITFQGWMKTPEGGLRYQTRIPRSGQTTDLYLIVWRVQDLPACQHPDHPGDPAYTLPAGRYFFDDEGVLVQKEGWNDGKDGKEYYTNANGMVTQERAK